jgi:hypothetical protein
MERKFRQVGLSGLQGTTLFYFTDNMVSYYVIHNGSSTSPALHDLIRRIKILEVQLGCRLEAVHVPGKTMICQGTDGLSRGIWVSPDRLLRSSIEESRLTLQALPMTAGLGTWVLRRIGLPVDLPYVHHSDQSSWSFAQIQGRWNFYTPSPELARQAITTFLDYWVEDAETTGGIFVIPRILQRQWGSLSKHVVDHGSFAPSELPLTCHHDSLIPFCILVCRRWTRRLPDPTRMDTAPTARFARWHQTQAEEVRRLR